MNGATPRVSVILPCYNRASYLKLAVQSVFAQTFTDWELIVVDDGSTDEVEDYLPTLTDPRVHVVRLEHRGLPPMVRNEGAARAAGPYLAFLDSDDAWMPDKLEVQLDRMGRHPAVRWCYTHFERIDAAGERLSDATIKQWHPYSGAILDKLITLDAIVAMPTVMVERSLFDQVGAFDETLRYCSDYDLWFRLAAASDALALDARLSKVRSYPDSHTADRRAVHRAWIVTYQKLMRTVDGRAKRLCRRQCTQHRWSLATGYYGERQLGEAFRQIGKALLAEPFSPTLWGKLLRGLPRWLRVRGGAIPTTPRPPRSPSDE